MQNRVFASAFRIEQSRGLLERGHLTFGRTNPVLINGDHRCDLIAFAAQGGDDVPSAKLEHNRNIVNANSGLPEIDLVPNSRKGLGKQSIAGWALDGNEGTSAKRVSLIADAFRRLPCRYSRFKAPHRASNPLEAEQENVT
jgi:hypothetical protein